jgi:hypothetical protein
MLEIFRGLRKFLDTRNISDSDVPPAKAWFDRLTTLSNVERAKARSSKGKDKYSYE